MNNEEHWKLHPDAWTLGNKSNEPVVLYISDIQDMRNYYNNLILTHIEYQHSTAIKQSLTREIERVAKWLKSFSTC